jgi:hypothetical protein
MKSEITEYIFAIGGFIASFFSDLQPLLWSIGFLIMTDTGLAIWASWRIHGRKSITSRKMGRIVTKIILYPLAIIVAKVAEQYLAPDIPWLKVTTGIVATVEIKSIFEKMNMLLGYDLWSRIKKAIWKDKHQDNFENNSVDNGRG